MSDPNIHHSETPSEPDVDPNQDPNVGLSGTGGRTPPMRSPSQLTSSAYSGRTLDPNDPSLPPAPEPVLERDHEATLVLLLQGVVDRRMSIINIQHGPTPQDCVGMPVAAWVLGECLLHWALRWRSAEVTCCTFSHLASCCITDAERLRCRQPVELS